jgi:hypothetical protein
VLDPVEYCAYFLGFGLTFLQTQNSLLSETFSDLNSCYPDFPDFPTRDVDSTRCWRSKNSDALDSICNPQQPVSPKAGRGELFECELASFKRGSFLAHAQGQNGQVSGCPDSAVESESWDERTDIATVLRLVVGTSGRSGHHRKSDSRSGINGFLEMRLSLATVVELHQIGKTVVWAVNVFPRFHHPFPKFLEHFSVQLHFSDSIASRSKQFI